MTRLTRGPLPAGVYWRRRLFVLGLSVALVLVVQGFLRGGSDGSDGDSERGVDTAQQMAGDATSEATTEAPDDAATAPVRPGATTGPADPTSTAPVLAAPSGPCTADDIVVVPEVEGAVAGRDVTISLRLRTREVEACTWTLSSKHLTIKVSRGDEDIWASRQCPRKVPEQDVVVRRAVEATVDVVWSGKYSEKGCDRLTGWAMPGEYAVAAAAFGGEPEEATFDLARPTPEVVSEPPSPTGSPSGAVEPGDAPASGAGSDGSGSGSGGEGRGQQPAGGR